MFQFIVNNNYGKIKELMRCKLRSKSRTIKHSRITESYKQCTMLIVMIIHVNVVYFSGEYALREYTEIKTVSRQSLL